MRITKPKRGQTAVKRLDLTDMRAMFHDRRTWSAVGIVTKPDDADQHWEIVTDAAGTAVDVIVEVVLQPSEQALSCRLRAGMWEVPALGAEVVVLIPEGQIDFMPVLAFVLSSNVVPTVQGPQPGRLAIINGEVVVHDGSGGAVSLALKSDVENVDNKYADHKHLASTGATGGPLATTVPNPVNPAAPPAFLTVPGGVPTANPESPGLGLTAATITGTTVLLGK